MRYYEWNCREFETGSGWLLYYSWARYFTSRDDDAGLAVALIALYIFFKPMQYLFVLYNYKKGVFHRMLDGMTR